MVVTCEIEFSQNPNGIYFAEQVVSGTVILKSDKPKDVKGVLLKITGHAETNWVVRRFGHSDVYIGREEYLSSLTYLVGAEDNTKNTIEPGTKAYSFACRLPANCPSSYEGRYGSVRYVAKVILVRPWKFDQTFTRGFTVLQRVDLNYETPTIRMPSNSSAYKTFCCAPCKTEPLKLDVHLPQTGFVPGQVIPVKVLVINNSNMAVKRVNFSLVMLVRYYSRMPIARSNVERIVVSKVKGDSVLRNCTRSLSADLPVSATPPSCSSLCNIIQIGYHIEVEAKMQTLSTGSKQAVNMPIIIGNVPLCRGIVVQQQPMSSNRAVHNDDNSEADSASIQSYSSKQELPLVNSVSMANAAVDNFYPDLPPPSYEESEHTVRNDINKDELHTFGPSQFTPLYPVYNLPVEISPVTTAEPKEYVSYDNANFEREI